MSGLRDFHLGRLGLPTVLDPVTELLGSEITTVGESTAVGQRRPKGFTFTLPIHGTPGDGDPYAAGMRMRRQLRSLMQNYPVRLGGIYVRFGFDAERNGWMMIGEGELADASGGVPFGEFALTLSQAFLIGTQRMLQEGRQVELVDVRAATSPIDAQMLKTGGDFAGMLDFLPLIALPPGASVPLLDGLPVLTLGRRVSEDGPLLLVPNVSGDDVLAFERSETDFDKADVAAYDRRGGFQVSQFRVNHRNVPVSQASLPVSIDLAGLAPGDVRFTGLDGSPRESELSLSSGRTHVRDGGWCWFNHPCCVAYKGVHNRVYTGTVGKRGDVVVGAYDCDTGASTQFTLHAGLEADDHDAPSLLVMHDGTIMAFYNKHTFGDQYIRVRRTVNPEDISSWTSEVLLTVAPNACYPYPARLTAEQTGSSHGRIWLLFRAGDELGHYAISCDDDGVAWTAGGDMTPGMHCWFSNRSQYPIIIQRPYFHFVDNGTDRIDMVFTDGHPREWHPPSGGTSLFHAYYQGGALYDSDDTLISTLDAIPSTGIEVTTGAQTVIQSVTQAGKCWSWDLVRDDATGQIDVAFTVYPLGQTPDSLQHYYWHARFTPGHGWSTRQIVYAGTWLPQGRVTDTNPAGGEPQYAGGICFDALDTNTIYLCRQVQGTIPGWDSRFDLERWTTDDGASWQRRQAYTAGLGFATGSTSATPMKACRPRSPRYASTLTAPVPRAWWTEGRFTTYVSYDLVLNFLPPAGTPRMVGRVRALELSAGADQIGLIVPEPVAQPIVQGAPYDASTIAWAPLFGRDFRQGDYFQSLSAMDLSSLPAIAFGATVSLLLGGNRRLSDGHALDGNPDYVVSNWVSAHNEAGFLLRVNSVGGVDAFVAAAGHASVGGTFATPTGVNPVDGLRHRLYAAYDTVNGLRLWIDGEQSATVFAAAGALDSTPGGSNIEVGQSPHLATTFRAFYGTIEDLVIESAARPAGWAAAKGHDLAGLAALGGPAPSAAQSAAWEEVHGPDWPWSWTQGAAVDVPVLDNGLSRVRYDASGGAPAFAVDAWHPDGLWIEQGRVTLSRTVTGMSTTETLLDTLVSAGLTDDCTPERIAMRAVMRASADPASLEEVYVTLQRGWTGPRFEVYASPAAVGTTGAGVRFTCSPDDLNDTALCLDAGGAAIMASAGATPAFPAGALGDATFTGENWLTVLREGSDFALTVAVVQAATTKTTAVDSTAYGYGLPAVEVLTLDGGYVSAELGAHIVSPEQILEAEDHVFTGAGSTASQLALVDASGGQAVQDSQASAAHATLTAATSFPALARYRARARVRVQIASTITGNISLTLGGSTITTTFTDHTFTWHDIGEIVAPTDDPTLTVKIWTSAGSGGNPIVDRLELDKLEDAGPYDGARDHGRHALADARASLRLLRRA